MTAHRLLEVRDLTVEFSTRRGVVKAVQHVDIAVAKGETLAIVGEFGLGQVGHLVRGDAHPRPRRPHRRGLGALLRRSMSAGADEAKMRDLRGREISMIFQNPRAALNPIRKVGHQIEDVLRQHAQAGSDDVTKKAIGILEQVKIARPAERYHAYPFELSGGMCQRVVIALALACRPQLLIADEPTTGLDVTTQKAVMDLVVELTRERGMSTILITHDLGLAAAYCDRVVVMQKGLVVETSESKAIFAAPSHAYTRKLMRATPRPGVTLRDLLPEDGLNGDGAASRQAGGQAERRLQPGGCQPRAAAGGREAGQGVSAQGPRQVRVRQAAAVASRRKPSSRRPSAPSTASALPCIAARASVWSASWAAASPPPRPWSCG